MDTGEPNSCAGLELQFSKVDSAVRENRPVKFVTFYVIRMNCNESSQGKMSFFGIRPLLDMKAFKTAGDKSSW